MWTLVVFSLLVIGAQGRPSSNLQEAADDICKEGDTVANTEDCRKFKVCKNNQLVEDHCMWPRKFDSVDKKCKWWGVKCAVPVTVPPTPATESTHPVTVPSTPATESTHPVTVPSTIMTESIPTTPVVRRKLQSVNEDEGAVCREGEKQPIPDNCRRYQVCENNKLVEKECFGFQKFDVNAKRCIWWGAKCAGSLTVSQTQATESIQTVTVPRIRTTESIHTVTVPWTRTTKSIKTVTVPRTRATESIETVTVPQTQVTESIQTTRVVRRKLQSVNEDVCKEGDKVADKDDCRKYQVCKDNKMVDDHCMWPRKFDSVEKKCMWWGATCASK